MKTKNKKRAVKLTKRLLIITVGFIFSVGAQVWAADNSQLNQVISAGTSSVDIVDAAGTTVGSPAVTFGALTFDFDTQDSTGTLGTSSERIRASNPTSTAVWTANLAGSATTAVWTDGASNTYDFNDVNGYTDGADDDTVGGQMTVDPSGGAIAGVSGCSTDNITVGASDSYNEETVDDIDLMSAASGAATFCRWDLTGVGLSQGIPAGQDAASYSITMNLTIL